MAFSGRSRSTSSTRTPSFVTVRYVSTTLFAGAMSPGTLSIGISTRTLTSPGLSGAFSGIEDLVPGLLRQHPPRTFVFLLAVEIDTATGTFAPTKPIGVDHDLDGHVVLDRHRARDRRTRRRWPRPWRPGSGCSGADGEGVTGQIGRHRPASATADVRRAVVDPVADDQVPADEPLGLPLLERAGEVRPVVGPLELRRGLRVVPVPAASLKSDRAERVHHDVHVLLRPQFLEHRLASLQNLADGLDPGLVVELVADGHALGQVDADDAASTGPSGLPGCRRSAARR